VRADDAGLRVHPLDLTGEAACKLATGGEVDPLWVGHAEFVSRLHVVVQQVGSFTLGRSAWNENRAGLQTSAATRRLGPLPEFGPPRRLTDHGRGGIA